MKRPIIFVAILVVLALLIAGYYAWASTKRTSQTMQPSPPSSSSDIYYDQNGCAQSRSGGVHPNYCIHK